MFMFLTNILFLITLLIFAKVCFFNLRYGIYIIIFLMPAYLLRTEIFSIPTTLLELMIYVLFLIWLTNKIYFSYCHKIVNREPTLNDSQAGIRKQIKRIFKNIFTKHKYTAFTDSSTPFTHTSLTPVGMTKMRNSHIKKVAQYPIFGIILLFLGITISTVISDDPKTSLGIFKGWFIDPFLFFIVLTNVIKTKKQTFCLFSVWLFSGLAVATISLFYLTTENLTYDERLKAFFLSPNHLAMYLAPAFIIGAGLIKHNIAIIQSATIKIKTSGIIEAFKLLIGHLFVGALKSYFLCLAIIIIFIPLCFTFSYGAFLGIVIAIFCIFLPYFNRSLSDFNRQPVKRRRKYLFYGIILYLSIFLLVFSLSFDKFQQISDSQDRSSFHSRLMIWNSSKEILKDNFVFGIGPGTFQNAYLNYADRFSEPYLEWAVPQPHNVFLAFWLQTGLLGLAGFILILVWFFRNGLRYKNTPYNSLVAIPTTLMIYFLIHGLVDTTYWKNDLSLMFWILIGVMTITIRLANQNRNDILK